MKSKIPVALAAAVLASHALAQVTVSDPWVRATVTRQKATGAFMQLTAERDARLVAAASPLAEVAEIHEMAMQGDIMKMRAVASLALPAGRTVALAPGGYHIMLIGLAAPIEVGAVVPLTLTIEAVDGRRETIELSLPVRPLAAAGGHRMRMR